MGYIEYYILHMGPSTQTFFFFLDMPPTQTLLVLDNPYIACQHQLPNVVYTAWMHLRDMYDVYIYIHTALSMIRQTCW